jgi:DNA-binding response OmpR family regulator
MPTSAAKHILIVDDDPKIRRLLKNCFEQDGYRVTEAETEAETLSELSRGTVDLITLDLGLGADDGLSIARAIRSQSNIPIVMVTGRGDTIDRVVGLELGADDYISKPFHIREVQARVRSVLRRAAAAPSGQDSVTRQTATKRYSFGDWVVDFSQMELTSHDGHPRDLTTADMRLLEVFVSHPKQVLTRDQLMDHIKGYDWNPLDRSIDNQILRLRRKIERDPKNPTLIKTVRGTGYSFTADVQAI